MGHNYISQGAGKTAEPPREDAAAQRRKMWEAFTSLDLDGNNYVTFNELKVM